MFLGLLPVYLPGFRSKLLLFRYTFCFPPRHLLQPPAPVRSCYGFLPALLHALLTASCSGLLPFCCPLLAGLLKSKRVPQLGPAAGRIVGWSDGQMTKSIRSPLSSRRGGWRGTCRPPPENDIVTLGSQGTSAHMRLEFAH